MMTHQNPFPQSYVNFYVYRWDFGEGKEGKNSEKMWEIVEFRKKISKWTGLFSVNGLGLNFCGIFEEKKLSFGFSEK